MNNLTIGFIGNPNCGKTTLFNAYTGADLKVANWPGVTVEKVEGSFEYKGQKIHLVDLPGTYSLTSYTMEEIISRNFILSDEVDVIINVIDAVALEMSLYLTLQLLELNKPVVIALNMMDIIEKRGLEIDMHRLPEMLGIPVIPVSARKRRGLDSLIHAAIHHKDAPIDPLIHEHKETSKHRHDHHKEYTMVYSDDIEDKIDIIIEALDKQYHDVKDKRWVAIKELERDNEIIEKYPLDLPFLKDDHSSLIINEKYDFIGEVIDEVLVHRERTDVFTEKVDKVLTNKWAGIPIFLLIMAVVFFLTFTVGDFIKGYFEMFIDLISKAADDALIYIRAGDTLRSLVVDGIIAGVGTIITFMPNILILFLCLALLEDSGYMARVAYIMEGIMSKMGLSGKAFIPMLLGFGCTVPAIMASRSLEDRRDRLKVMLVTPFMSCNARLTIYILFAEMFFSDKAMIIAYSMYLIGIIVAIITSFIIHIFDKGHTVNYLLIELPEYKLPDAHTVAIYVFEKVKDYLEKAGTTIFLATIIIWLILNFGPGGLVSDMSESFGAYIGRFLVPVFMPIGLGFWQVVVALIAGISAKEVVVSSMAVLFGVVNASSPAGMALFSSSLMSIGFESLNAFCLMVFCLLYIPCAATLATIKKESGSWSWTIVCAGFQLFVAWIVTFIVYQLGLFLI